MFRFTPTNEVDFLTAPENREDTWISRGTQFKPRNILTFSSSLLANPSALLWVQNPPPSPRPCVA